MADKIVSKKFVSKDFSKVGLVLITYALFCLYLPYLGEYIYNTSDITLFDGYPFDIVLVFRIACIIIASLIPFLGLTISDKKNHDKKIEKTRISLSGRFIYSIVFVCIISFVMYISTSLLSFINISTNLVSDIGISIDANYFDNVLYIVIFIIVIPIFEEFAFRKTLVSVLNKYGSRFAVYTSALIYAIAHCSLKELLPSFVMAYLLNKLYLKYRSFSLISFIHILYNLLMFLAISIPSIYNIYVLILLFSIYLIAIILVISRLYRPIILPRIDFNKNTFLLFISTNTVIISIVLFIVFGIITLVV